MECRACPRSSASLHFGEEKSCLLLPSTFQSRLHVLLHRHHHHRGKALRLSVVAMASSAASPQRVNDTDPLSDMTGLKELVDAGITHVPQKYIHRDQSIRYIKEEGPLHLEVPVIDVSPLFFNSSCPDIASAALRMATIAEIGHACKDWGFFQVVNHRVPGISLMEDVLAAAHKFFNDLPAEERKPYYLDDPRKKRAWGANWKETIRCESSSSAPDFCMEPALKYKEGVKELALTIYGAILESLGVTPDDSIMTKDRQKHIAMCNMLMHYYPPCPEPSLTFGLSEHTDAGFITVLLQDQVGGLEVFKDGQWIPSKPIPNALTINLADQMEILTNGRYASVLHRVGTNAEQPRISVPCFLAPSMDCKIGPLEQLIDGSNPPVYKEVVFKDYIQHYMQVRFADTATSGTDFAKI